MVSMIAKSNNVFSNNNFIFQDHVVKYEISHGPVFSATLLVLACWCSNIFCGLQTMPASVQ